MAGAAVMWGLMAPLAKDAMANGITGIAMVGLRVIGGSICFWLASIAYKAIQNNHQPRVHRVSGRYAINHTPLCPPRKLSVNHQPHTPVPTASAVGPSPITDKVNRKDLLLLFGAGLFAIVFNQCNYIIGLSITSPLNASIMTTTMPIITMILAALILKEPITVKKLSGVMLGCLGATTLILATAGGTIGGVLLGDLMCIGGQFSYAFYLTAFRKVVSRHHPITCQKWMMSTAMVVLLPVIIPAFYHIEWHALSLLTYAETAFVIIGGTFLSFLFSTIAQQILRPTIIAMYNYLQPIVACTISVFLGLGIFTIYHLAAAILVFAGVYLVNASKAAK